MPTRRWHSSVGRDRGSRGTPLLREFARHPSTTRCRLRPLTFEGTQRRLAKRWPALVTDGVAEDIHSASAGNPFVIDALAGELAKRGDDPVVGSIEALAPESLADWAMARAGLDAPARDFLMAVAVLGQGCELRHAAALANLGDGAGAAMLDRLVAAEYCCTPTRSRSRSPRSEPRFAVFSRPANALPAIFVPPGCLPTRMSLRSASRVISSGQAERAAAGLSTRSAWRLPWR